MTMLSDVYSKIGLAVAIIITSGYYLNVSIEEYKQSRREAAIREKLIQRAEEHREKELQRKLDQLKKDNQQILIQQEYMTRQMDWGRRLNSVQKPNWENAAYGDDQ